MTAEWMLNDKDDNSLYELLTLTDMFADQKIIADYAQRKLLEYLIQRNVEADMKGITAMVGNRTLNEMLKQLEDK